MLTIHIPKKEGFDERTQEFVDIKSRDLRLEHSLVSISKWESKHNKPFLSTTGEENKTAEETLDYIRCMTITQNVPDSVYGFIPSSEMRRITEYIDAPMTATTFNNNSNTKGDSVITAEIIYHWMIAYKIPFECQKWHLNRLLTLINVCSIKSKPPKKMSKSQMRARYRDINSQRKQKLNTKG